MDRIRNALHLGRTRQQTTQSDSNNDQQTPSANSRRPQRRNNNQVSNRLSQNAAETRVRDRLLAQSARTSDSLSLEQQNTLLSQGQTRLTQVVMTRLEAATRLGPSFENVRAEAEAQLNDFSIEDRANAARLNNHLRSIAPRRMDERLGQALGMNATIFRRMQEQNSAPNSNGTASASTASGSAAATNVGSGVIAAWSALPKATDDEINALDDNECCSISLKTYGELEQPILVEGKFFEYEALDNWLDAGRITNPNTNEQLDTSSIKRLPVKKAANQALGN